MLLSTGTPTQWTLIGQGDAPRVTVGQEHLYTAAKWALLLVDALIGVVILLIRWRQATAAHPTHADAAASHSPRTPETGAAGPEFAGDNMLIA